MTVSEASSAIVSDAFDCSLRELICILPSLIQGGAKVDDETSGIITSENSFGKEVELQFWGQDHSFCMPGVPPFHVIAR